MKTQKEDDEGEWQEDEHEGKEDGHCQNGVRFGCKQNTL
jgi:hypothetical protein